MSYQLSGRSLTLLQQIHPDLARVVRKAIELSTQDFCVIEGVRTIERQQFLLKQGKTRTLNSRHLEGNAVDLVPWIQGSAQWHWPAIYPIAEAMRTAAGEYRIALRWGGAWDVNFTESTQTPQWLNLDYAQRRRQAGHSVFIDGVHFELHRQNYP